ncbi:MAG: hypothetical protein ACOCYR_05600 [Erythrobacter sp.]
MATNPTEPGDPAVARRKGDRRVAQLPFEGPDRRKGERRSGDDRRRSERRAGFDLGSGKE